MATENGEMLLDIVRRDGGLCGMKLIIDGALGENYQKKT
jgi:hypothetical protein